MVYLVIRDELQTAMQLVGITSLSQATPDLLNTVELDGYVRPGIDRLSGRSKL